jgi:hypothetical protein
MSVYDPTQEIQCSYNEEKNVSVWNSGGRKKVGRQNLEKSPNIYTNIQT